MTDIKKIIAEVLELESDLKSSRGALIGNINARAKLCHRAPLLAKALEREIRAGEIIREALEKIKAFAPCQEIPDPTDESESATEMWNIIATRRRKFAEEALAEAEKVRSKNG